VCQHDVELTLVCLSNSYQTRYQQPNPQVDIDPRIQFMFGQLEQDVEEPVVVLEEYIRGVWALASKCRT
jgi:hypothetical protein